jgi:hypothetical protein
MLEKTIEEASNYSLIFRKTGTRGSER